MTAVILLLVGALVGAGVLLFKERRDHHAEIDTRGVYQCRRCGRLIPLGFAHQAIPSGACVVIDRTKGGRR